MALVFVKKRNYVVDMSSSRTGHRDPGTFILADFKSNCENGIVADHYNLTGNCYL